MSLLSAIDKKISKLTARFDTIPPERKALLMEFAGYLSAKVKKGKSVKINFICTHNSRRSQMSQVWAQTSAEFYGINGVDCYSGGTEATEFNSNALLPMENSGFVIARKSDGYNPIYLIKYSEKKEPVSCFSKVYNDPFNPQSDYAAVMTCSDADETCPVVIGAERRFPIRYEDPKMYDGTELQTGKYIQTFDQIGTEMLFTFLTVKRLVKE